MAMRALKHWDWRGGRIVFLPWDDHCAHFVAGQCLLAEEIVGAGC